MTDDNLTPDDLARLEAAIPIARNNHTEVVVTPNQLEALLAAAREHDAVVEVVRRLHVPIPDSRSAMYPEPQCSCGDDYPCETIRAVDDATRDGGAE